jgi:hypothetical protein
MKLTRKLTAALLTLTLLLTALPASAADTLPFTDVPANKWYYNAVSYVYDHGIMAGNPDGTFDPESSVTRGMLVTILHNLAGKPKPTITTGFSDVPSDEWYTAAVYWAKENGVVAGYPDGTFAPTKPVTRAEFVVTLYGFAKNIERRDVSNDWILGFGDNRDIDKWAQPAVKWAVSAGVISGNPAPPRPASKIFMPALDAPVFSPNDGATRAEAAAMLYKYVDPNTKKPEPDPFAAYMFPYDIPAIIEDAKAYGASIGMTWVGPYYSEALGIAFNQIVWDEKGRSTVEGSWEAPGATSADYAGERLWNAIKGGIDRIKKIKLDNGWGDDPTWHFSLVFQDKYEYYTTHFVDKDGYPETKWGRDDMKGEYTIYWVG